MDHVFGVVSHQAAADGHESGPRLCEALVKCHGSVPHRLDRCGLCFGGIHSSKMIDATETLHGPR